MAGEALLINPRRKRRRARRKTRRRPRVSVTINRRRSRRRINARRPRRHRINARRHRRRRARINPRLPLLGNVNIAAITGGAAGYIGTRYATGWVLSLLPAEWGKPAVGVLPTDQQNLARIGVKALVGIVGVPMLLKFIPGGRRFAGPAAIGGGIAVAVDLFETYLAKMVPIPMADYEQQVLTDYETRALTGTDDGSPGFIQGGAFGSSAYGGGAF